MAFYEEELLTNVPFTSEEDTEEEEADWSEKEGDEDFGAEPDDDDLGADFSADLDA